MEGGAGVCCGRARSKAPAMNNRRRATCSMMAVAERAVLCGGVVGMRCVRTTYIGWMDRRSEDRACMCVCVVCLRSRLSLTRRRALDFFKEPLAAHIEVCQITVHKFGLRLDWMGRAGTAANVREEADRLIRSICLGWRGRAAPFPLSLRRPIANRNNKQSIASTVTRGTEKQKAPSIHFFALFFLF
jgi:hypothetical protein